MTLVPPPDAAAAGSWPAVASEQRDWERTEPEIASRRTLLRARGNYTASVPPFISGAHATLPTEVQALADDASRELTRFDAEAGMITAPFASILLRTESAASSEVENLISSAKQVALAEIGASDSGNARLVVANASAMKAALSRADSIDEASIIMMHEALLGESAPEHVGAFRSQQVWIGGGGISPHGAMFVPPHHERVPALMADLVEFSARTDIPVLAHSAIAHAQFETIHPFPDGNGRTGRALLHSMLRHGGLTRNVTVPVSAGLLRDTSVYFDALGAYRAGDLGAIVTVVAEATFHAVRNGQALVTELREIAQSWEDGIPARRGSAASRLKELLLRQPVITAKVTATELGVSEVAAQAAIDRMVENGVLQQANSGKRNRIWHAQEVLAALDAFGARARRRF